MFSKAIAATLLVLGLPSSTTDWGLEALSRDTRTFLNQANELLDRSSGGDTQAMRELAQLLDEHLTLPQSWRHQAAIRGDKKAMLQLIFRSLDTWEPSYYTAFAWINAAYRLGVLNSPGVGRHGYGGDHWCDEKWFAERMEPHRLRRAAAFGDKLYEQVLKHRGGQP